MNDPKIQKQNSRQKTLKRSLRKVTSESVKKCAAPKTYDVMGKRAAPFRVFAALPALTLSEFSFSEAPYKICSARHDTFAEKYTRPSDNTACTGSLTPRSTAASTSTTLHPQGGRPVGGVAHHTNAQSRQSHGHTSQFTSISGMANQCG